MKEKMIAGLMVLLLLFAFIACSKSATQSGSSAAAPTAASGEKPVPPAGFPSGPITIIVPQSAGGGTDIGVRLLAKYAQEYLSQPLVVVNMPGGSTIVGIAEAFKKPTDGHTLIQFASATILATAVGAQYDCKEDFDYVSLQVSDPRVLAFNPQDKRFATREEFIQYVKANPGELTLAVTGLYNASHISAEVFMKESGLQFEIVNFDGQATMKPAFRGRHIDTVWQSIGETKPMIAENQVVCVAVMAEERYEDDLPGVPTARELGVDVVASSYRGYAYKKGVDKAIVDYMAKIFELVSKDPEYIQEMANLGLPNTFLGPKDYTDLCEYEVDTFAVVVRELGMVK